MSANLRLAHGLALLRRALADLMSCSELPATAGPAGPSFWWLQSESLLDRPVTVETRAKPGAEKMRTLFSLQTKTSLVEKDLDRPGNFAMFTYQTEVRDKYGALLATCDGSCSTRCHREPSSGAAS